MLISVMYFFCCTVDFVQISILLFSLFFLRLFVVMLGYVVLTTVFKLLSQSWALRLGCVSGLCIFWAVCLGCVSGLCVGCLYPGLCG